jgi:hypothetical protein
MMYLQCDEIRRVPFQQNTKAHGIENRPVLNEVGIIRGRLY